MIRHTVLMKWTSEATKEQQAAVAAELSALPAIVPSIRAYVLGADLGLVTGNFDFAVSADFDDEAGYLAYRSDPAHLDIINRTINPITAQRVAVQFTH
jgi:hypothetical protein